ncbi:alkaline phosphatase family protein [Limobrevibacterium gyesilva]|uniref:PKD domain-containing protein n=1 Tax=Limobrevibacterium gyesilva TaxID=2991712 RepID=A0AA42CGM2_9PROT|nr:alkaline phosphatase family protein [Limobrevibacterium gyesilva]MCW3477889.1 hypothetical protein [Limobrevibacterium gyesilva]
MAVPNYDHIVVVVMENHDYSQIIGNSQAPYINSLAASGALLTNYDAISHPSEPNYFAMYAGSTFGITDDNHYSEPDPTLDTILQGAGKTFTGYVEGGATSYDHNPWESFPEGFSVEKDFSTFPSNGSFSSLPNVSFVVPNVNDDMHNGTIQQGDTWLQSNLNSYVQWATNNNSLLVVVWDESDTDPSDHVAAILYGAHVMPGAYNTAYNHYNLLSTLLAANNLTGPRNAATATPIDVFSPGTGGTLAGQVQLSGATEGVALAAGTTVASFTDTNTADPAGGFNASISWGDGTSSAGGISGANGSFTVSGGHTYADEGSFLLSVAVTRTADNATITPTGAVTAAEADVLTPQAATITGTAQQALSNVTVATFTDSNSANAAGDFTASISWGDGSTSAGVVSGTNGTLAVSGSHTYASAGTDPVAVTLTDDTPGTAAATANSTAQIGGGPGALAGQVQLSGATEGVALASGTAIARFTDTNSSDTAAGFTASITWGDGTTTAGTVTRANKGSFLVSGGHTYADEGSFPLSVAVTRTADGTKITPTGTVVAAEADVLTPHAATITGTAGQALNNVTVATFTNGDTANPAGDFTASITWGDGTTSAGTVSGSDGSYSVTGSHTYTAAGTDAVAVSLTDDAPGTARATANSPAQIASGAGTLAGSVQLSSATEGSALASGTTIASFTDTNSSDTAAGFTASITWGDGTTTAGTVSDANGSFSVAGGHTYADEGSFPLSVAITRIADNTKITPTGTVVAAEADVLTGQATTITGTAGQALNNVTVATFTNSDTANPAGDFTASVTWGDGTTSAGTVSGSNGTYSVAGSHTYAVSGTDTVAVSLTDDAPGTAKATANSTAQIAAGGGGGGRAISSPTTGPVVLAATNGPLTVTNSGAITSTGGNVDGVDGPANATATVINFGSVSAAGVNGAGVYLQAGGSVTNSAGASISGDYGVEIAGAPGTVSNSGTISGTTDAVLFVNSGSNSVVVNPTAAFKGLVDGGSGANALELAGGTGSISGLSGGSGTVTENGSWSFASFQTVSVDTGGTWTLNGGNVPTIANNGTVNVSGSLDVSSAIDPTSSGLFQLTSDATLEVAAAIGSNARMTFLSPSELVIDNPLTFGSNVGSASYAGSTLQSFGAGDMIDLKQFGQTGAATQYDTSTGLLQISNGTQQHASLDFQTSSLGSGSFHVASDGSGGILVTLS